MERELELEVTKSALFLEDRISSLEKDKRQLCRNKPQEPTLPNEPVIIMMDAELLPYPPINPVIKKSRSWKRGAIIIAVGFAVTLIFSGLVSKLGGAAIWVGILLMMGDRKKAKREREILEAQLTEEIRCSPEYRKHCKEVDEENKWRQAQLDKELHENYMRRYENYKEAMQEYEKDTKHYKESSFPEWSEEYTVLETALADSKNALQELYDRNIIPFPYRNFSSLLYLALFLGTSDYDLKTAIERFDIYVMQKQQREHIDIAKAQLEVAQEQLQNQKYINFLQEQLLEINEQGNNILQSISHWQKADISLREYRRYKAKRDAKKSG